MGIIKNLAERKPEAFDRALQEGLKAGGAKSYPYFALAAAYLDGKPIERILIKGDHRMLFVPATPGPDELDGQPVALLPDLGDDESEP